MSTKQQVHSTRKLLIITVIAAVLLLIVLAAARFGARPIVAAETPTGDTKSVIVTFKGVGTVTSPANKVSQQKAIDDADKAVAEATDYATGYKLKTRSYDNLPYAVYTVDAEGEQSLRNDPNVASVVDNNVYKPLLNVAVPAIGGSTSTGFSDGTTNYTGDGYAVAILDTGVDVDHPMLGDKVVAEACFGTNETYSNATIESFCPGGATETFAAGSSQDCDEAFNGCGHGTGVASIAAGISGSATVGGSPVTISGVAKDADIIAMQVFIKMTSVTYCGSSAPCALTLDSLYVAALDHLLTLSINNTVGKPIVAANMSLGAGAFADEAACEAGGNAGALAMVNQTAAALKARGIATLVANGNAGTTSGNQNKIGFPACASGVISVGATNLTGTTIASYSQNGPLTELLAPGGDSGALMTAAEDGGGLQSMAGTSMATPMVTGAFAVLREKHPNASVDSLLALLQTTGTDINDARSGYTVGAKKKINLAAALVASPLPTIATFTGPSTTVNEGEGITLNATVTNSSSCSLNNGVGAVTITAGAITANVPGAASYTLTCINSYGDSVQDTISLTINPAPTTPALNPGTYNKEAGTYDLTWTASTDDDGIAEYRVYLNGQLVATLPPTTTSYTFENLLENVNYTAEVRAIDTLGAISTAASVDFGNEATEEEGTGGGVTAPNTGAMSLLYNADGRALLIAAAGIVIAGAIVYKVARSNTRRSNR